MGYWYNENAEKVNIAVSTRVRLARNIKDIPFPSKMTEKDVEKVNEKIKTALNQSEDSFAKTLKYIRMKDIPENERFAMVERHIISREFASVSENRAIIISEDETVTVMIGEEDHIRIQVICAGFEPEKAYETAERIDNIFCNSLDIAYDKDFGFLTECPTNLGTGLRVSVMLHLPLLESSGNMPYIVKNVGKFGFTVRGMYGEGSKSKVSLYQLSNQITLGISENDAIENLIKIANGIMEKEENLLSNLNRVHLEDKCMRSLYTLKGARIMSSDEMMEHLSCIMMGINAGIIESNAILPIKTFIEGQPFMLMSKYGNLSSEERDIKRAEMLRKTIITT